MPNVKETYKCTDYGVRSTSVQNEPGYIFWGVSGFLDSGGRGFPGAERGTLFGEADTAFLPAPAIRSLKSWCLHFSPRYLIFAQDKTINSRILLIRGLDVSFLWLEKRDTRGGREDDNPIRHPGLVYPGRSYLMRRHVHTPDIFLLIDSNLAGEYGDTLLRHSAQFAHFALLYLAGVISFPISPTKWDRRGDEQNELRFFFLNFSITALLPTS